MPLNHVELLLPPPPQPLRDPKEEAMASKDEVAMKNQAMDEMLAELHGTQAFREFVISHHPGANIPKVC